MSKVMERVHAFVPVHEGCVEFATKKANELSMSGEGWGEVIWSQKGFRDTPLKAKIGGLRVDGYVNIHVIGDKEMTQNV